MYRPSFVLLLLALLAVVHPTCAESQNPALESPTALGIVMLTYNLLMGIAMYFWGYSIGYYLRYPMAFICGALCASIFVEFDEEKLSSAITWVIVAAVGCICVVVVYFSKKFFYCLLGFYSTLPATRLFRVFCFFLLVV